MPNRGIRATFGNSPEVRGVTEDHELTFPVSVGKCIYCGSTDDLSDEHVIPRGFNGVWKLKIRLGSQ